MGEAPVKFLLSERDLPTHWINLIGDLPGDALPPLNPRTMQPAGPHDLTPDLPHGADRSGGLGRAGDRDPRGGARRLPAVAAHAAVPRPAAGAGARYARPTSTTSTRASPRRARTSPTPPSPRPTRTPRPGSSKLTTETGAGQWGSSLAFACSLFGLECEVWMVGSSYDQKPYRRSMMQTWGATVHRSPVDAHRGRPRAARAPHRLARDRHLRGGRGRRPARRHQLLAGLGAQPRAAAPDRDRPGGARADGDGRRAAGRRGRLRGRGLQLRRPDLPVPARGAPRRREDPLRGRRAVPPARPSPAASYALRLRRHRRPHAADADVHPRPRLRAAAGARRRPALPRRLAAASARWSRRVWSSRAPTARTRPSRRPCVRPHRGHHPGARARPRHPGRDRGGRRRRGRPARRA